MPLEHTIQQKSKGLVLKKRYHKGLNDYFNSVVKLSDFAQFF